MKDNLFVIAIFITIAIAYLSFIKVPKIDIEVSNSDKWGHSFAYFTLSICWLLTFYKYPTKKHIVIISCIVYGIIIEVLQGTVTAHRTADFFDALAN
ncbi:VanZ family protein, partial [Polaribacter sp.]|nr:VanZ family protein [Polaribacter sp.]